MNEALNQDEINDLLSDDNSQIDTQNGSDLRDFDFKNQEKNLKLTLPSIDLLNESLARFLKDKIDQMFKQGSEVSLLGNKYHRYNEYINSLTVPSSVNLLNINPLKGTSLIVFDANLVLKLVDSFFGGKGHIEKLKEPRSLTLTEQSVIDLILNEFIKTMQAEWQKIYNVTITKQAYESNPNFINILRPDDLLVISKFQIELESGGGEIHIAYPYTMLEPIKDKLLIGQKVINDTPNPSYSQNLKQEIYDAKLDMNCVLTKQKIKFKELKNVKPNDVIELNIPELCVLKVNGIPLFYGKFGTSEGKYAVEIMQKISKQ